jgi:uncharacterized small protein (DUF1192 family)
MISDDDTDPKTKRARPRNLDNFSVPDLREYLEHLKTEMSRVEAEIAKKEKHKNAADSLFKSSS